VMKHWKDMNKFEKIEAVRGAYTHGMFLKDIAAGIPGSTAGSVGALFKRNRTALSDCPLGVKTTPTGSRGVSEPIITADQMADLTRMRQEGMTLDQMGVKLGVSTSSVRRAFTRYGASTAPLTRNRVTSSGGSGGQHQPRREDWKARISDMIDSDMGRLIHEGPSPERRALMEAGRI